MASDYRIGLNPEAERLMFKIRDEFRLTNSTITNMAYFALRRMLRENGGDDFIDMFYEDYQRYVMKRERDGVDGYDGALMRAQRAFGTGGNPTSHRERTMSGAEVGREAATGTNGRPGPGDPGYMSPKQRKAAERAREAARVEAAAAPKKKRARRS